MCRVSSQNRRLFEPEPKVVVVALCIASVTLRPKWAGSSGYAVRPWLKVVRRCYMAEVFVLRSTFHFSAPTRAIPKLGEMKKTEQNDPKQQCDPLIPAHKLLITKEKNKYFGGSPVKFQTDLAGESKSAELRSNAQRQRNTNA